MSEELSSFWRRRKAQKRKQRVCNVIKKPTSAGYICSEGEFSTLPAFVNTCGAAYVSHCPRPTCGIFFPSYFSLAE